MKYKCACATAPSLPFHLPLSPSHDLELHVYTATTTSHQHASERRPKYPTFVKSNTPLYYNHQKSPHGRRTKICFPSRNPMSPRKNAYSPMASSPPTSTPLSCRRSGNRSPRCSRRSGTTRSVRTTSPPNTVVNARKVLTLSSTDRPHPPRGDARGRDGRARTSGR